MLVLSRKLDESIILRNAAGEFICEVFVVEIRGEVVRLGVDAPLDIEVQRKEIDDAIQTWGRKEKDE